MLQDKHITMYMYTVGNLFALAEKRVRIARKRIAFLPISYACTNKFDIFWWCIYIWKNKKEYLVQVADHPEVETFS